MATLVKRMMVQYSGRTLLVLVLLAAAIFAYWYTRYSINKETAGVPSRGASLKQAAVEERHEESKKNYSTEGKVIVTEVEAKSEPVPKKEELQEKIENNEAVKIPQKALTKAQIQELTKVKEKEKNKSLEEHTSAAITSTVPTSSIATSTVLTSTVITSTVITSTVFTSTVRPEKVTKGIMKKNTTESMDKQIEVEPSPSKEKPKEEKTDKLEELQANDVEKIKEQNRQKPLDGVEDQNATTAKANASEKIKVEAEENIVPLNPDDAPNVVRKIKKTGNVLLDQFLSQKAGYGQEGLKSLVHFDLKGAAPKIDYLIQLVPLLKQAGASGILIEYEDMFPYSEELAAIRSPYAYSIAALKGFLKLVKDNGMVAVPLVQTFGHMEFVLKHASFQHLREDRRYPAFLNPAKQQAVDLVKDMIAQVMAVHGDGGSVHIGCGEVHLIGASPESRAKLAEKGYGTAGLYLDHVRTLAKYVQKNYRGVRVLVWDDMLRQIPAAALESFDMGSYVEPVIWSYSKTVETDIPESIWIKYAAVFESAWVASAFKGASGSVQHLPDLSSHLQNQASWLMTLRQVREKHPKLKIRGLILTGSSRYEHFSALCDLLPVSIPSLVACLQMIQTGTWNADVVQKISQLLRCSGPMFALNPETLRFQYAFRTPTTAEVLSGRSETQCYFPGQTIFYTILIYHQALASFEKYFDPITGTTRGQCNRYSLGHGFANPFAMERLCIHAAEAVMQSFRLVANRIPIVFRSIYGDSVSREWLEEHLVPFMTWLQEYYAKLQTAVSKPVVWGQRPDSPLSGRNIAGNLPN